MKTKGFTLIELLVVLGVLTILFSISIYNINSQTEYTHLDLASKRMADILNLARKNAIAGQMTVNCDKLNGYKIVTSTSDNSTTMQALCANGDWLMLTHIFSAVPGITVTNFDAIDVSALPPTLDYNLAFFSFQKISGLIIYEQAGNGNIIYPSQNKRVRIVIKNTNTNLCSQFRINPAGFINDCKLDSCDNLASCVVTP